MDITTDGTELLELISRPAFCAKNNVIMKCNQAAARVYLRDGLSLDALLESGAEDYAAFSGGTLYVTLSIFGQSFGASVLRIGDLDVFTLDQQFESEELRVLALAARELRGPLTTAMLAAQTIQGIDGPALSGINHSLYQLLRIIGNMSDASGSGPLFRPEMVNLAAFFREFAEKNIHLTGSTGITVSYSGLEEPVSCAADCQMLERAALNMLSNALKYTPAGGTVRLSLAKSGRMLRFSVEDSGCGISEEDQKTLFARYLREPSIEDSRHGIGLGMLLIRNAAARHKGAVLIDHPNGTGTRITLTIATDLELKTGLLSTLIRADYAGEQDHALIELSDILPTSQY